LQSELDTQTSSLRNSLKIKSFELERLGMAHEQVLEDVRKLKMENDVSTKKAALLKKEYYTLESEAKSQRAELDQQVRTLSATMRSYEGHEMEGQLSIAGKTPTLALLSCVRPNERPFFPRRRPAAVHGRADTPADAEARGVGAGSVQSSFNCSPLLCLRSLSSGCEGIEIAENGNVTALSRATAS
jgi:hypothetical protein